MYLLLFVTHCVRFQTRITTTTEFLPANGGFRPPSSYSYYNRSQNDLNYSLAEEAAAEALRRRNQPSIKRNRNNEKMLSNNENQSVAAKSYHSLPRGAVTRERERRATEAVNEQIRKDETYSKTLARQMDPLPDVSFSTNTQPRRPRTTDFVSIRRQRKKKKKEVKEQNKEKRDSSPSVFRATIRRLKELMFGKKKTTSTTNIPEFQEVPTNSHPISRTQSLSRFGFRKSRRRPEEIVVPFSRSTEFPSKEHNFPPLTRNIPLTQTESRDTTMARRSVEPMEIVTSSPERVPSPLREGCPNVGNSCYWNAVLQCLAAVPQLAEYFVNRGYNQNGNLNSRQKAICDAFRSTLLSMWSNMYGAHYINILRQAFDHHNSSFTNCLQQDAHEFLLSFMDSLSVPDEDKGSSVDSASLVPEMSKDIFSRLFSGVICDKVECRNCSFTSPRYTVCNALLLAVNDRNLLHYTYIVPLANVYQYRVFRKCIPVCKDSTVEEASSIIAKENNIDLMRLLLFQTSPSGWAQCLVTENDLTRSRKQSGDGFHAVQLYPEDIGTDGHLIVSILLIHAVDKRGRVVRLTEPFIVRLAVSATYQEILETLFIGSRNVVRSFPKHDLHRVLQMFNLYMHDDNRSDNGFLIPNILNSRPLLDQYTLRHMDEHTRIFNDVPKFIRMTIIWNNSPNEVFNPDCDDIHHGTINTGRSGAGRPSLASLFALHFSPEILDGWRCDSCRHVGGLKTSSYEVLPRIIVITLKRFDQHCNWTQKIETGLHIPLDKFDASPFLMNPGKSRNDRDKYMYECIGLICHTGTVNGGHYFAYTRNPVSNIWRHYDDSKATIVETSQINTEDVYIAFFQRSEDRDNNSWINNLSYTYTSRNPTRSLGSAQNNEFMEAPNFEYGSYENRKNGHFRRDDRSRQPRKKETII